MLHRNNKQTGFALLMSLIVVSVVVSVGLTLIDLTIMQLRLASGSKDSESSFHAANAGVECMRYWRHFASATFETGVGVLIDCFGDSVLSAGAPIAATPNTYKYTYEIDWPASLARCTRVTMITMNSDPTTAINFLSVPTHVPGYPNPDKTCGPGGRCTILSVQGYNQVCSATSNIGTVQREVLLEL